MDEIIKQILETALRMDAKIDRLFLQHGSSGASSNANTSITPANDTELDSPKGNPVVKSDPKKWKEENRPTMVGKKFSECPPEGLDQLVGLFQWKAKKEDEEKATFTGEDGSIVASSKGSLKRARLAAGWAKRLRTAGNEDRL